MRRHLRLARWLRAHLDPTAATGSILGVIALVTVIGGGAFGVLLAGPRPRGFADFQTPVRRDLAPPTRRRRRPTSCVSSPRWVVRTSSSRSRSSWVRSRLAVPFLGHRGVCHHCRRRSVRPRRCDQGRGRPRRPDLLRLTGFSGPSFPSGHATASAAIRRFCAADRPGSNSTHQGFPRRHQRRVSRPHLGDPCASRRPLAYRRAGRTLPRVDLVRGDVDRFGGRRLRFGAPLVAADQAVADVADSATRPSKTMAESVAAHRGIDCIVRSGGPPGDGKARPPGHAYYPGGRLFVPPPGSSAPAG